MNVFGIDPGPDRSAYLQLIDGEIVDYDIEENSVLLSLLRSISPSTNFHLAIEGIASYGMPVGKETFETCYFIGKCLEAFKGPSTIVLRRDIKIYFCGSMKAKDANIRQAVLDKYGGKEKAIGKKSNPGPLYGIKSHLWPALALALFFSHTK